MSKTKTPAEEPTRDYRAAADLLKEALDRPGVEAVFSVYEKWKTAEGSARPHMKTMAVKRVVTLSNSSACNPG